MANTLLVLHCWVLARFLKSQMFMCICCQGLGVSSGQLYLHPHNSTEILEAGQSASMSSFEKKASMPSLNFAFLLVERIPTPLRIKTRRCFRQHWDESHQCSNKVSRTVHHVMSMIAYRFPIVFPCFPCYSCSLVALTGFGMQSSSIQQVEAPWHPWMSL